MPQSTPNARWKPTEAKAGKGARIVTHDSVSRQWKSIKINDESDPK